ncbi:PREDICTED: trimethyllysine dioxygenase, mitochondrial-like [Amphimedon queenslandica]|uniref:Gamma-butyrobetaine dioxygenase n=1 Tax=Amphimedon queenslandica TaxID=400682 RepID=A0AAN0JES0_AMPQE|nr:PREDICTED: trimethyllysine dioxygenase, mitochondrial-like [Amphimedon queenslandica]|eukprot:XP_019855257.1 PREDICTED: trimethyllysine dioxygenase, mitochondrial-like [Amphimedon queenslandica]
MNSLTASMWCLPRELRSARIDLFSRKALLIARSLSSSPLPPPPSITQDGKSLSIPDPSYPGRYHAIWLRHHCQCPECMASTGQRTVPLSILSGSVRLTGAKVEGNRLQMDWELTNGDPHSGYIDMDWLKANNYSKESLSAYNASIEPTVGKTLPVMEHKEIIDSTGGLWKWLYNLNNTGACLIKNVPQDLSSYRKMVESVCPVLKTIYGEFFDVKIETDPINIAYTDEALDFHMDLVYYQSPPGIQLLHCIRNDSCIEGGHSLLLDVLPVVEEMRKNHHEEFLTLTKIPATFQKIHFER